MRRLVLLTVAMLALAAACGVPGPGEMEAIDERDVRFNLANTSTTSTTTTTTTLPPTTTTTVTLPTSTEVAVSTTTTTTIAETTTTTTPVRTEFVDLYFVSGSALFPIPVQLAEDADAQLIFSALLAGPQAYGEVGNGLRSAIPEGTVLGISTGGGQAVVDIPPNLLNEMTSNNLTLMFGQIVLTLFEPRCLGQVKFTSGGESIPVFLANGLTSEPGQPLSCADYTELISSADTPPGTTTIPSTTPSVTTTTDVDDEGPTTTTA